MRAKPNQLTPLKPIENLLEQGSPTFMQLRATSWYRLTLRATSLIHIPEVKFLLNLPSILLLLTEITYDESHHVNAIFKTDPRAPCW